MITDMSELQTERDLMQSAEAKIRNALDVESPGRAASEITDAFSRLQSSAERHAFVAVLASRVAIKSFIDRTACATDNSAQS